MHGNGSRQTALACLAGDDLLRKALEHCKGRPAAEKYLTAVEAKDKKLM